MIPLICGPDHKVLVDGADTTPDFLAPKLAAGAGITLTVLNPGGDEQVQIDAVGAPPTGAAGGDLGGTYPNPTVVALEETSSPARLAVAGIADGTFLKRSGGTIVGVAPTAIPGVENFIRYAIGTGATQDSVTQIPAAAIITSVWLDIQTPYTGGATISIGQPGSLTRFQLTTDNNPQAAAIYENDQDTTSVGLAVVRTTIAGAPVAGSGFVLVRFTIPDP